MTNLSISEFTKISFLDQSALPGRFLCSLMFYNGEWQAWIEADNQLIATRMWPAEALYFGTTPEQKTDMYFHFLNIMGQRVSFLPISRMLFGLQDDIFNLSASLAKVRLLHRTRNEHKTGVSRMVATEVEYLHGVCRSIFDLWQEFMAIFWDNIKLADDNVKNRQLKKSYREMIFISNQLRTVDEVMQSFPGLPRPLAECYVGSGIFFSDLRKFRDRVIHQGAGVQIIFDGEDDFLISEARVPFSEMKIWLDNERKPNGLVPLMPALAYVIYQTLTTCERFSETIEKLFILPQPLVPNCQIFLRGYFDEELLRVSEDIHRRLSPRT